MPVERSAGIILYRETSEGRKFLVIRSSRDTSMITAGKNEKEFWDFPKGRLDAGETGIQAAEREAKEEVGITKYELLPDFKKTVQYFTWRDKKPIPKFVALFLAKTPIEKVVLSWEHDTGEWLSYEEAKQRITLAQMREALEKAEEFLNSR